MLENLTAIDWWSLHHAYGCATNVPDLLRQRASDDPEEAKNAEAELFGCILHQGTVYDSTAPAVPFLVELLKSPRTVQREGLIILLAGIAQGTGYYQVHARLNIVRKAENHEEIQARLAEENQYVPRAHAAVEGYLDDFLILLEDTDQSVRQHIPCLLAVLNAAHPWLRKNAFDRAQATTDAFLAANLLFALSTAVKGESEWAAKANSLTWPQHPILDVAVAHVVLLAGDSTLAAKAAETAMLPVLSPGEYIDYYAQYFFEFSDGEGHFLKLLPLLPKQSRLPTLKIICASLPEMGDMDAAIIAGDALYLAFDSDHLPANLAELSPEQRVVLKQIDRSKQILHDDGFNKIFGHLQEAGILSRLEIKARRRW